MEKTGSARWLRSGIGYARNCLTPKCEHASPLPPKLGPLDEVPASAVDGSLFGLYAYAGVIPIVDETAGVIRLRILLVRGLLRVILARKRFVPRQRVQCLKARPCSPSRIPILAFCVRIAERPDG